MSHPEYVDPDLTNYLARQTIFHHIERDIEEYEDLDYSEASLQTFVGLETLLTEARCTPAMLEEALCVLIMTNRSFRDAVFTLYHLSPVIREVNANSIPELVLSLSKGDARWLPGDLFKFDGDIFDNGTAGSEYHVSTTELATAALRVGLRCDLWLTALDANPLMELVRRPSRLVYVA